MVRLPFLVPAQTAIGQPVTLPCSRRGIFRVTYGSPTLPPCQPAMLRETRTLTVTSPAPMPHVLLSTPTISSWTGRTTGQTASQDARGDGYLVRKVWRGGDRSP